MQRFATTLLFGLAIGAAIAQHAHTTAPKLTSSDSTHTVHAVHDSTVTKLVHIFTHGHASGHIRNYFMATVNDGELKDYWTNAIGGALHYETAPWKGLQFGVKGIFTYKAVGMHLDEPGALVDQGAKWETELYDVRRPEEDHDLDRLEELYVKLHLGRSHFAYGKLDIDKGPLFLRRDGRMKPFVYRGFWGEINEFDGHTLYAGYINGVSPRGYTEWFDLQEAIGLGNNGYQPNGDTAHYHEHTDIKGIYALGYEHDRTVGLKMQVWNYLFQKNANITWLQADFRRNAFLGGIQYVHERAMPYQQDLDYTARYMQTDETAHVLSGQLGWQFKNQKSTTTCTAAYLKAFDTGRFLFPRELGREDFYVSQYRSWIDGFGDLDVYMIGVKHLFKTTRHNTCDLEVQTSRTEAPSTTNSRLNKYGQPSFYQANFAVHYHFGGKLEGLDLSMLYIAKITEKDIVLSPDQVYYKTNLHHMNLVANINF